MATRYWYKSTAGAANWATTTNWYSSPNGVGALGAVPANTDDIVVDPSVNNIGTLNIEAAKICNSFVATGFPGGITGTFGLTLTTTISRGQSASTPLFGLPTNSTTYTYSGTVTFGGGATGGGFIYCNGNSFKGPVTFAAAGATFNFQDTLRVASLFTLTNGIVNSTTIEAGTFSSGTGTKTLNCTDFYLTGTGALAVGAGTLTSNITNIYVTNNSTTAKTLTLSTVFGSTNVYLSGSGVSLTTLAPVATFQPNVYVTSTNGTVTFTTGTIKSLTFSPGTTATWSNAATQTLTIVNNLTLLSTQPAPTVTPSLIFTGPSTITLAGKSLVTGTVTTNETTTFADAFSSNAAVTLNAIADIKSNFSTTSTITQGGTGTIYMSGSSLTATTTTIAGTMIPSSSLAITGALTLNAAVGSGTLSTPANSVITCTGTTTLQNNATVNVNGSYTSNAITVTNGNINVTTSTAAIPLTCTNTLSFTAGAISAGNKTVYAGYIATLGTAYKDLTILNLYLTGTGALYAQTAVAELYSQVSNLYIVDSSNLAKTLSCTTQFPYYFEASSNIYLAGSGTGTITVAPVTTAIPNIYVTNTNGTASFSTGTINSLTFSPGTTTNWNNAASQTLTINTSLTLTGSMACTVTPALTFSGTGTVIMAGKSLVTGALISNGSTSFIDAFSSNAAVTLNSSADIINNFSTTSTLTVGSDATAYIYGSSLTATTITVAGTVQALSNLGITGSITLNAAVGAGTLTTPANSVITCTGTTTLQNNATVNVGGSFTSNAITVTNGTIDASTGTGILTCTNILSLSTGAISAAGKTVYAGSITTSGAGFKDLYISNLYLTGTGALYTQTSVTNLNATVDNTYIVNSSGTPKILTCTTQFPYSTSDVANIYLAGSGAGTITLAPSTVAIPKIYVTNTGGAPISFSTGTVHSIFFNTGTTAVWSNAASQIITMIAGELNLAASIPLPTQTPAFIFQNQVTLLCNGVPLVGGELTCDTDSSVYINSLFNSNIAVTIKSGAILYPSVTCTVASVALQGGQLYVLSGITNITGTLTATTGASSTYGPGVLNIGNGITATGATTALTLGAEFCNLTGDTSITGGSTLTVDALNMIFPGTTTVSGLSTVNTTLSINNSGITFTDLYLTYTNVPYTGYSLTCTGILSTSGDINIAADPISVGNFINVSNTTGGPFIKTITCTDFIFTGIGTLHDVGNYLTSTITNVYVNNNSTSAKTLTIGNGFGSTNVYLQGSQNGSLTLIPGTTFQPNVYVTNTGRAVLNISTAGTIRSLIFDPTSNVNWNNSAVAVTLIGSELTLASSITASATPSLVTSNPIAIAMAGKSLATGTLITNSTSSFIDAFSSNAAVTLNSITSINDNFVTTGTLAVAGLTNLTGQYISASALTVSGLTAALNIPQTSAVTCTGTTTLTTGGSINYSGSLTSNAITVTSGFINGWDSPEVATLTCTGILTMTSGSVSTWPKDIYVGSITTSGASPKTIYANNIKLTGTGTLFTPGSATNFLTSANSIEIADPSDAPKTLTCTSQFPTPGSPIYLAGSGSITIGPGTAALPYIYVTSTIEASVSFLTGTATSLIFSPGTNATWNNLPGQTLTLQNELTLTSSQPQPLLTPSLAFVGNGDITMAGKSLVTGTLTVNDPSTVVNFLDNFSTNAAVAFSDASVVYTPYNFTAPSVTVGKTAYWLIGYNGTSLFSPTVTIAGGLTITGTSTTLGILGGTLNVAGAISQTSTGGNLILGDSTAKLPVTISCTTFTVGNGNSFYNQFNTTINLSGTGTVWNMGTTLAPSMELSTINITDTSVAAITFAGGQGTYKDVIFNRGAGGGNNTINHSNSFVNLRDLGTAAHGLLFGVSATNTILGTLDVKGSPGNNITMARSTTGTAYIQKGTATGGPPLGAGLVLCDYVTVSLLQALDYNGNTASGVFYAGPNSTVAGSTGWNTGGKVRSQGALGVG